MTAADHGSTDGRADETQRPERRSIRLQGYDYSQAGAYYVTVCTLGRECLFGQVTQGEMLLNDAGRMVEQWYFDLPNKYPDIDCGPFIVMPNHAHCIIVNTGGHDVLNDTGGHDGRHDAGGHKTGGHIGPPLRAHARANADVCRGVTVGAVIQWFKTMTTNAYIRGVKHSGWPPFAGKLWQRNYYEHIIRNEGESNRIQEYIANNPQQWHTDHENPDIP